MSMQQQRDIEDLKRRVERLEDSIRQLIELDMERSLERFPDEKGRTAKELLASMETLTLPEKRKSA